MLHLNPPFIRTKRRKTRFTFVDLFAGIGGIRIPFQELGGKCVFTSEIDKFAKRTYLANFGEYPEGDITEIDASVIPGHDVLLAGFPCQAFSQAGLKKGFNDTRGTLFFEIQRIISVHKPKIVFLENVKQLVGHNGGKTLGTILDVLTGEDFNSAGLSNLDVSDATRNALGTKLDYKVGYSVMSAKDFGVPQNRQRIYIVAVRSDVAGDTSVQQIFERLNTSEVPKPRLGDILESDGGVIERYTISDRLWKGHVRRKRDHRIKGNGFGYGLFTGDSEYCNTISARYYKDGSEILIDQSHLGMNPRKITPREAARIQGFPENFIVNEVSDGQAYRQFGNSVAIPVVRALAEQIYGTFIKN
ncbi:DNA (cytosine-5-)-methyltransferase [Dehalococcoidia bacterium]|nr:DNA (cytosine-5-)-methyltransferase [Dehalococcoidia bacterium]